MKRNILSIFILFSFFNLFSQEVNFRPLNPKGIRFYLDKDSTSYFRVFSFTHVWARYTEMNPGTVNFEGEPMGNDFDIGIRRNRSGFYFHLFDRAVSFIQFGISGQTYTSQRNPQMVFLDLTTEYDFIPKKLTLGYGLHSWNGVARQSNVGAPHFLYVDNPGFSYPLVGTFDQSGRQLGIFAKGLLGDFQYRVSFSKPFTYNAIPEQDTLLNTAFEYYNTNFAYKAYFNYQFLDNEQDVFPWKRMNYLGTKRVFNLGFGIHYQPDAMKSFKSFSEKPRKHDMLLLGVDAFLELPQANNASFTGYFVYYNYDFGPNYVKTGGLMNTGKSGMIDGLPLAQGGGNSEFTFGTGQMVHAEAGYLLPSLEILGSHKMQFFAGYTIKNLNAVEVNLHSYDFGLNYFIFDHHVKWGFQYSTRPIYKGIIGDDAQGIISGHKGTYIFNTQIDF